jgi:hypothetical protein
MSVSDGETEARNIAGRTDDALRAVLFQRLLERLEAEQKKDPTIRRFDRPYVFSLSRQDEIIEKIVVTFLKYTEPE